MKTNELISLLSNNAAPVPSHAVSRRVGTALALGLLGALLLLVMTLGLRPDLRQAITVPSFWWKLAFGVALALAGVATTERLSRPGQRVGWAWMAMAAPVLVLWLLAASALHQAAPEQRLDMVLGQTWQSCPFNIAMLSVPMLAASFWCLKGLAPTRLTLAGASAGVLSGAISAAVYALHCPESEAPFVGVWYVLGVAVPTMVGAVLGPRVLRW